MAVCLPVSNIIRILKMQYDDTRDRYVHILSILLVPIRIVQCHREEFQGHMLIIKLRLVDFLDQY